MTHILTQPAPTAATDPRAAIRVYYDGGCPVCSREIGWYRAMRGAERVDWVDISTGPVPDGHTREALLKRFTILRGNGSTVTGAEAFAALWRSLRPTRWLGRLSDRQPFLWIGERLYRAFLKLRMTWR
jgi:predicted DCC family thiol-disulfide oxidoreductase YuxK